MRAGLIVRPMIRRRVAIAFTCLAIPPRIELLRQVNACLIRLIRKRFTRRHAISSMISKGLFLTGHTPLNMNICGGERTEFISRNAAIRVVNLKMHATQNGEVQEPKQC